MTGENFLMAELVAIHTGEGLNLVVQRLTGEPFAVGCGRDRRDRVHRWLGDIFNVHGNVPFPDTQTLVIGGGDKLATILDKRHRVDRTQMTIIFLANIAGSRIPAQDLLVGHARQQEMRVRLVRCVELDGVGYLAAVEALNAFTRFRVPKFERTIVAGRYEAITFAIEANVTHGLFVSMDGHNATTIMVRLP